VDKKKKNEKQKADMLRTVGESVESVRKKKGKAAVGRIRRNGRV